MLLSRVSLFPRTNPRSSEAATAQKLKAQLLRMGTSSKKLIIIKPETRDQDVGEKADVKEKVHLLFTWSQVWANKICSFKIEKKDRPAEWLIQRNSL